MLMLSDEGSAVVEYLNWLIFFMSMGRGYVSELRPPTPLLFSPEMIYEHGEPWWNDTDRRKFLIRPPELCGNCSSSHLVAKQEDTANEIINVANELYPLYS
jgi:hypothetical protein